MAQGGGTAREEANKEQRENQTYLQKFQRKTSDKPTHILQSEGFSRASLSSMPLQIHGRAAFPLKRVAHSGLYSPHVL